MENNSKRRSREEYSADEIKKLGSNVALFCLCESRHRKKVKKAVIIEHVVHGRSKNFNRIMKYAKQKLTSVSNILFTTCINDIGMLDN